LKTVLGRLANAARHESPNARVGVFAGDLAALLAHHGVDPQLRPIRTEDLRMDDADLFALCIWTEARGEPYEGKAAVARVIHNRIAQGYFSDGTVAGTVLKFDQFSAFWFAMRNGQYARISVDLDQAQAQAAALLPLAQASAMWADCQRAVTDGAIGSAYAWGAQGLLLNAEPRALLYCDPAISSPVWATDAARVAVIWNHTFFRA
jgi:spore germination cell wall hydrolase CwlJ-like protein